MVNFTTINEKAVHASYPISLRIAQTGKPHTVDKNLILTSIKDRASVMFGKKMLKDVETIPLPKSTIGRRIDEIACWVEDELIARVKKSKLFALQIDESTNVQSLPQPLAFVRYIFNDEVHEDMLFCQPIVRCTSEAILGTLNNYFKMTELVGLDWMNCVGICTGGARAICGRKSRVMSKIIELNPDVQWTHCSLHKGALVSKGIAEELKYVLNNAVKTVNYIKSRPLQSRLF